MYCAEYALLLLMAKLPNHLPDDLPKTLASAHAMIVATRALLALAQSELTIGRLEIERLKLLLAKARREHFGQSSERGKLLIEQLELAIDDLGAIHVNCRGRH